jgi:hypothetical protein
VAATLAALAVFPAAARAGDLADATLAIAGARLTVSPESQTVPFDTPTEVLTQLSGFDAAHGTVPPNLLVVGDFTGPQISGVLTLSTTPGQPFQIPRLQTEGIYQLDNIRLMQGGTLLGYSQPRSAALTVTQVLITRVTSRALTADEIRGYGIVVTGSNRQAYEFTFAFAVAGGNTVNYSVPVVYNQTASSFTPLPLYQAPGQDNGGVHPRFAPPRMAPFKLDLAEPGPGIGMAGGCMDYETDCESQASLPIPGVILFPADVSLLHQFFSVILMVQNGAPAGDPLVLRDLSARVTLPPGLRQASTRPPTPLGVPVPIRVPGPDGILGTADDITFLVAQASGQAEVLTEGIEQGTHIVQFDIAGVVDGLPGGKLRAITGHAQGAVVVRDPTLNVTVTHPEVVRTDEQYQLLLTVTNTGNSPANQLTLRLPPDKLAGVQVVGDSSKTIDLLPGDSQLVEFTLLSKLTGRVVADAVRNSSQITPTFDLSVGVGEKGIPLSPNAIILPDAAASLPPDLLRAGLNLLGLGYSLATAPPSLLTGGKLPQVGLAAIDSRVYELAQAGVEVSMGEALFDSAAILAALWSGAQDQDSTWDQLRRITQKGGSTGARLAAIFAAEAAATSPRAAFDRFAATTAFVRRNPGSAGGGAGGGVAGIEGALAVGAGAALQVTSRAAGLRLAGGGEDPARLRELPFGDLYLLDAHGGSQLALMAVPEATGYQVRLRIAAGGTADLHLLVPAADGTLRMVRWQGITLAVAGSATVAYLPGDASFTLQVDAQGTGAAIQQVAGSVETLAARPFGVVAAMQNAVADPTGHVVDLLFSGDVDRASLLPLDPGHFLVPGKLSNGGLTKIDADSIALTQQPDQPYPFHNSRRLRVVFNNPLSPYAVPINLTVVNVKSAAGEQLSSVTLPVKITVTTPGEQVSGVVLGGDGRPVPFAQVTLHENDFCLTCGEGPCNSHKTAIVEADASGHYLFDYVRSTEMCGDSFGISATNPVSDEVGIATGRVRFIGSTARLDVLMLGRGTIRGRIAYDDGSLVPNPQVIAFSPVFRSWGNPSVDAHGNYSVSNVPVGTITLSASDSLGHFVITTLAVPSAGSVVAYDLIVLRVPSKPVPTGQVSGQVVRADGTTPVALAYVALYVAGNLVGVQRSDASGNFDFGIVPAGQAEIDTFENETGQSGVQVFFQVNPDQATRVTLRMNVNRGSVEGHVYRQAGTTITPVAGAVVWVDGTPFHTFSDAQGFYHLDGVFTGSWVIYAADLAKQVKVGQSVTIEAEGATATRDLYFQTQLASGIAGQVLDFGGSPVAGATVHLAAGDRNWFGETTTDANGGFTLPGLAPGGYGVHAYKGTAGGTATAVIRFAGDTPFATIRFKQGTIKGVVQARDQTGQVTGLKAAVTYRVTTVRQGLVGLSLDPVTIETNDDGTFEIDNVLAGNYQISVYNAFYGSKSVSGQLINQGEVQTQTLIFQKDGPGTIKGIVLDQDGVTPAAGANVHLAHPAFSAYDLTAGADGSFEFDLVPPTVWNFPVQVTFQQGVVFRQAQVYVSFTQPGQTLSVVIVLPRQGSVAGVVQDADGHPVPAAVVTLSEGHYPYRQMTVNTDANAAFQFTNVFAGDASLSARAPTLGGLGGKTSVTLTNEGQALTGVLIKLQPTGTIAGRVLSPVDGSPVPNAEVKISTWYVVDTINADDKGRFEFDLLPLASYDLHAFDPRTGRQGHAGPLQVTANDQVVAGDVTLEARGGVLGHLYDPDATPPLGLPAATVSLTSSGVSYLITYSSTDALGAFQFQGIPQGDFTLAAREPQGRRNASGKGTIVHEGDQVTVDLYLQQEGVVTGSALNPAGTTSGKFQNVNVTVVQDDQVIGGVLASDYRFGGIIVGRPFELRAQEVGGPHAGATRGTLADPGPVALDVQMVPIGSVRVVVQDSFGNPVPGADVTLYTNGFYGYHVLRASSSAAADALFQDIGAGALGVEVHDPVSSLGGGGNGSLTTDGQIVQLTVKLEDTGTIQGTLLLADGVTPAAGATAALRAGGGRSFLVETDPTGAFAFHGVPLGGFDLNFQQSFGPGTLEVLGAMSRNGQVVDLGTLTLDATDMQVLSITPAAGATNVALTQAIAVAFNKPVDGNRNVLEATVTVTRSDGQGWSMNGSLSADGKTITLVPNRPYDNATTYLVRVNPPAFAVSGRQLPQPVQASFTTVDHLLPAVIHVDPARGAVQVPLAVQPHLIFNRPVDPASLSGSHLQLLDLTANAQVTTTFTPSATGRELLITPQAALAQEHQYQLTVQGLVDLVGNVQAQPFVSNFFSLDQTPPRFGAVQPAAGTVFTAGDPVAISAAASDPSGVHDVSFQLGPRSADVLTASAGAGGVYAVTLTAPAVRTASDLPISIAATDAYGNVATTTVTIHVLPNPNTQAPAISTCLVDGDAVAPGIALSVPFTATDDQAVESYDLVVNGQTVTIVVLSGARSVSDAMSWTPPAGSAPGTTFAVRLDAYDFAGNAGSASFTLQVPAGTLLTGDQALPAAVATGGQPLNLAHGKFTVDRPLAVASLTLMQGASLAPAAAGQPLAVVAGGAGGSGGGAGGGAPTGAVRVQCGAALDVTGLGYPGGVPGQPTGYAPPWVAGAPQDAGGSHGGAGIGAHRPGPGGPTFDSVYLPQLGGGGGSQEAYFPGNAGAGAVSIDAGSLWLAGSVKARGIDGCLSAGSAGGSVLVHAGTLAGAGTIDVRGGDGAADGCATTLYFFGGGGGGRAAIYATTLNGFNPVAQVLAGGGALPDKSLYAAPGTLLVRLAGQAYGDLYVDGGAKADGTPLPVTPTALPQLGSGALAALAPANGGADAWASATAGAFTPEWLGAWMNLLDAAGKPLGAFQATSLDAAGRLLLAGAGSVPGPGAGAAGAASYRGELRFDHVRLLHNAGLLAQDPVVAATLVVTGANPLGAMLRPVDVDLKPGAAPVPPSGSELDVTASGTVTIEAGAKLDVSGQGYAGAYGQNPVLGPPNVTLSSQAAGGSHGGAGWPAGNGAGEVYDSVVQPALPGGGGGGAWSPPGGGVVRLSAANLVLDGRILADGGPVCNNGSGAGGTVAVTLSGALSGGGTISAAGGTGQGCGYFANPGGGGRVALVAGALSGFDPARQVQVAGGIQNGPHPPGMAAAGTLFTKLPGQTYGSLRVDAGAAAGAASPVQATVLPAIGRGVIGSVTPAAGDPASAWITAQAGGPRFGLGATGMWVRIGGADFLVTGQSADRTQLLLAGAAAAAVPGAAFVGVYKFDQVTVTGAANLEVDDAVAFAATQVDPGSTLKTLDLLPPVISNVQPAEGTVFTSGQAVAISFAVADDDLASVTVSFGEQSVTLASPPFTWTVPAPPVAAAADVPIRIVATDKSANSATATRLVHVLPATAAGPPSVALTCPSTGAMLAPGTSLNLAVTASEASGIAKVEMYLGSSAGTPITRLFSPPYAFSLAPPAGATDGQALHVVVRATSFGNTAAETAADFTVVTGNVVTAATAIAPSDTHLDGASLIVAGGATVTIDGPHAFRDLVVLDGATVTHSPTTAAQENHLALTLARGLYVACGGAIDVTNRGYQGAIFPNTSAWGYGNTQAEGASPNGTGGSHGGRGGRYDGSSPVYGNLFDPQDPGAGGGYRDGSPGDYDHGGGVVRIGAGGAAIVDGAVRASGGQHPGGGHGGGAGGSIMLNAAALAGTGVIQALGGIPSSWPDPNTTGGGSGGRIALYGHAIDAGLLGRTSAAGGAGTSTDPATWGAAGTVFAKLDTSQYGDLIVDNAGIASSQLTELLAVGAGTVSAVAATAFTDAQADFHHDLAGLGVAFNGNLAALYPIASHAHHGQTLTLQVAAPPLSGAVQPGATYGGVLSLRNLVVRGAAKAIDADAVATANPPQVAGGASWTPAYAGTVAITSPAAGATFTAGAPLTVAANVADVLGVARVVLAVAGGGSVTLTAPPYTWSTNAPAASSPADVPVTATVFAASGNYFASSVTIHVNPAVDPLAPAVALTCWRDGDLVTAGAAIPISFTISDAVMVSSYSLIVNGATVATVNPNQPAVAASLGWTPPAGAAPGTSFTVTVSAVNPAGHAGAATLHLVVAPASALGGSQTLGSSYTGQSPVLGPGTYTVPAALSLGNLTLLSGARVVGVAGSPLALTVAGTLAVECGGAIDVSALGYPGATTYHGAGGAPPGVRASQYDAGGSHGGPGIPSSVYAGPAGDVFDSVYLPQLGGGGGSLFSDAYGARAASGGGAVNLTAGTLRLYGQILARGESRTANQPGGAGGAVQVHAGTLAGTGTIDASGGAADSAGSGGGGRVALYVTAFSGFDPVAQAAAQGGSEKESGQVRAYAGPGTVYWKDGGATYGRLLLDSGRDASGHDQVGPASPLPALGAGAVAAWTAAVDPSAAWLAAAAPFAQPWLGAWVAVKDAAGNLLGEFQATQIDGQGRLLLAGAGSVNAAAAASYQGEYRFDRVDLRDSAGLAGGDPVQGGDLEVSGAGARLPAQVSASSMTLASGAVVGPAAGGSLAIAVSGQLTIPSGARIDVTGLGYKGGTTYQSPGGAPPGVRPSGIFTGGSHGGPGLPSNPSSGAAGDTYDSVYLPQLGGGGAGLWSDTYGGRGGNGGGVVSVTAGTLQLDGQIVARGEARNSGYPAGAGGAVQVHAGTLAGAGSIDASGGAADAAGSGGGGRVALWVTTFQGFDPAAQALAQGGTMTASGVPTTYAGAGTVFAKQAGDTYGRLIVDRGKDAGGNDRLGPASSLPPLGAGVVGAWTAAGGDAWLAAAAAAPFGQSWLGAWVAVQDGGGSLLGEFQVSQIDGQGRLLLARAGSLGGGGAAPASYQGEYRFDRIDLRSSAAVAAGDLVKGGDVAVAGAAAGVPAQLTAASLTLASGTVLGPASGGTLQATVAGTLTIPSGARIDVTGLGYLGATAFNTPGTAPPNVNPSQVDAGGSHGGAGRTNSFAGPAGEPYDSVFTPQLAGGGASVYSTTYGARGGNGGGAVILNVGTLQLDGQILALGESRAPAHGGAGGTVQVHAATLAGAGSIDVSGGGADAGGSGGGGRVALYVTGSQAFSAATQVKALGGAMAGGGGFAGPGTVFDQQPRQTYGSLRVDAGSPPAGTIVPATVLPAIGRGVIATVTPAASDPTSVWITAQAGTPPFSLGAAGMWVRISGTDYRVIGQSADRTRLLLQGAAAAAAAGQGFFGVYKLDQVTVTGGATVQLNDALLSGSTQVDSGSRLVFPDLLPPVISGIQPAAGTAFTAGQPVAISANVSDDDLATVAISFGEQSVTLTAAPFSWTVPAPPVGAASDVPIQIVATDGHGNTATATQLVHVVPATAAGAPAVALTCPSTGAMLAPGTSLKLAATAAEASGIAKVELFLGSATTPLAKAFSPPYALTFTAPAGSTDGQVLHVRVRATSFGNTTAEAAADFTVVTGNVLTASTTIAASNATYDGASLIVAGGATVTLDGPHTFRDLVVLDGATVTHSPTTAAQENHLVVSLTRNLYVACGGAVDATGLGYLGGAASGQRAYGYPDSQAEGAAATGAGGSFGGRGGRYDGSSPVYGSFYDPQDAGAGGGWAGGAPAGNNGGGVVRITANAAALIDGAVRANGGQHPAGGTGGGAGGAIRLNAAALAGAGVVQALGGPPTGSPSPAATGGGSGGRIALYATSIDPGLLARTLAAGAAGAPAAGGGAADPATSGAAGTLFVKLDASPYGDLIVDNGGVATSQITELLAVGSGTVGTVGSNTITDALADFHHDLSGIDVAFNGNFGTLYPILANAHHGQTLTLSVPSPPLSALVAPGAAYSGTYRFGNVTVRGGAQVVAVDPVTTTNPPQVASGSSWTPAYGGTVQITSPAAGATFTAGNPMTVSASVTDLLGVSRVVLATGGQSFSVASPPYTWSTLAPGGTAPADFPITATAYGSGGNRFSTSITIHSNPGVDPQAPVVTLGCWHEGDLVAAGSTVPISFTITDATQVASYSLVVNGTVLQTVTANQPTVAASLNWTVPAGAAPGNSYTVQISAVNSSGHTGYAAFHLAVPTQAVLAGNLTLGSSYAGQSLALGAGTFTVPSALSLASLTLLYGAKVTGVAAQPLNLSVAGTLAAQCGSAIDMNFLGYQGPSNYADGTAPPGVTPSHVNAGGSHGGSGTAWDSGSRAGDVFDGVYMPLLGGGSGTLTAPCCGRHGGNGGGVINLAAGNLVLNGVLRARGEQRSPNPGVTEASGAGGTVAVQATTMSGTGTIDASGEDYNGQSYAGGAGGGGRVALYVGSFQGFDPASQVKAWGGAMLSSPTTVAYYAGPGTIFWKEGSAASGRLLVDSGKDAGGNDRAGSLTALPALGSGAVAGWTAAGGNALLAAAAPFGNVWLGAWVALLDGGGNLLGEFLVSQVDGQGRLLLAGAGAVTGAVQYQGEYRFDRIDLKSSAGLTASDPIKSGDVEVYGAATRLPAQLATTNMTVNPGSVAVAGVGGVVNLTVSGTLTVPAGARIDVTAQGYQGPSNYADGTAPPGVSPAHLNAGGSHGGAGTAWDSSSHAGAIYDGVYLPLLGGGSGTLTAPCCGRHGGNGGGVINLTAGTLQLDGVLRARGEQRALNPGVTEASGAGGTVVVHAGTIAGAGSIDASGEDYNGQSYAGGAGGGGRVALYATTFQGFSPATQVKAWGGAMLSAPNVVAYYAGPGTIFWKDGSATSGRLLVDSGKDASGNDRAGSLTALPVLGSGAVTAWTAAGGNALLAAAAPFGNVWLGAWVALLGGGGNLLGEFQVSQVDGQGRLLLAGAGGVTGAVQYQGEYRFDRIDLKASAGLTASDPIKSGDVEVYGAATRLPAQLTTANMTVNPGSVAVAGVGGVVTLTVTGTLTVPAGARIDVTAQGYPGPSNYADGTAPPGVSPAHVNAGGSHGGAGTAWDSSSHAGAIYDGVYLPLLGGGSGTLTAPCCGRHGGNGGGVINLTAGTLQLDGVLRARGEQRALNPGVTEASGAGGTVVVHAATIAGAGSIDASGEDYNGQSWPGGAGGGGRVALYATTFQSFDPTAQVKAWGGAMLSAPSTVAYYAGPGTVFWKDGSATAGRLMVDSGQDASGHDRAGSLTALPALGSGAVTAWTAAGGNALLAAAAPFGNVWLGAWVALLDGGGNLLGEFLVSQVDGQGRLLLAGAGAVTGAVQYQGEYRFDRIELRSSAGLTASDPIKSGDVEVYGAATRLPAQLTTTNMTVNPGSVAVAGVGGAVSLTVSGTLTVPAGARIDVTAQGYPGPSNNAAGTAPPGVSPAQGNAGGSHGGTGTAWDSNSHAGALFDSLYAPLLGGGSGTLTAPCCARHGGNGGGVINLTAGTLQLDGVLRARGEQRALNPGVTEASGAGGTVVVHAATIAGAGSIDASGEDYNGQSWPGGAGGGGRVALYATTFQGFSPAAQVKAWGGSMFSSPPSTVGAYAGPGTVFWKDGHATYGQLIVDSGKGTSFGGALPITPLPSAGAATVGTATADAAVPANVWITASGGAAFQLGLTGMWVRVGGTDYQVVAQSADLKSLELAGGAGSVAAGASFRGVYKFDEVDVRGGAKLQFNDTNVVGVFKVDPNSAVIQNVP